MRADHNSIDDLIAQLQVAKAEAPEETAQPPLKPPLDPPTVRAMAPEPNNQLASRVTRLEYGLCAAFIILAGMICGLYLYTNGKFDTVAERAAAIQVQGAQTEGKIDLLLERTAPKTK